MTAWLWSSIGVAALLGMRHGLDADHLAAIDGLSRLQFSAGRPRIARASGALFSAGHGAVVLSAATVLALTGARVPDWLGGFGSAISIGLLLLLGSVNLRHALGADAPAQPAGGVTRWLLTLRCGRHAAGGVLIGALFALSFDTITLAAWFGTAAGAGSGLSALLCLALAFVVGMIACDGANGLWIAHLIGRSRSFGAGARRVFSALVAAAALAVAAVGIVRLELPETDRWFEQRGLWTSGLVSLALLAGYLVLRRERLPGSRTKALRPPHAGLTLHVD